MPRPWGSRGYLSLRSGPEWPIVEALSLVGTRFASWSFEGYPAAVIPHPDRPLFAVGVDVDGSEQLQLQVAGSEGNRPVAPEVRFHALGPWHKQSGRLIGVVNTHAGHSRVVAVSPDTGRLDVLHEDTDQIVVHGWSADGQALLLKRHISFQDSDLLAIGAEGHRLWERRDFGRICHAAWDRYHPQRLVLSADLGQGFCRLARLDAGANSVERLPEFDGDVEAVVQLQNGGMLCAVGQQCGVRLGIVDGAGSFLRWVTEHEGTVTELVDDPQTETVAFTWDRPGVGREIQCLSASSLSPLWSTAAVRQISVVAQVDRVEADDGVELETVRLRPADGAPRGKVIYAHGGPALQQKIVHRVEQMALVAAGFEVIAPNVRGSSGYGAEFMRMDDGVKRHAALNDFLRICDCYNDRLARNVVMGVSYGGFLALNALIERPHWDACISIYGISDFESLLNDTARWRLKDRIREYGDPANCAAFLRSISPRHRLSGVDCPVALLHGDCDARVPLSQSRFVREAVPGASLEVFEGAGHGFVRRSHAKRCAAMVVLAASGLRPGSANN